MTTVDPVPLIVCGYPRSGTRMCANFLANSRDVELQGEMPPDLAEPTLTWLKAMKHADLSSDQRFYRLCRTTFRNATMGRRIVQSQARYFGHKTPGHERWFQAYETIFGLPTSLPRYVYCLRNPFSVWRSYRAMPWASIRDVRVFVKAWVQSVQCFEHMRATARARVCLFNLDDLASASNRLDWIRRTMLDTLEIDASTLRRPVDDLENTNSSEAKLGLVPPQPPESELAKIARDPHVWRTIIDHFPGLEAEVAQLRPRTPRSIRRLLRA